MFRHVNATTKQQLNFTPNVPKQQQQLIKECNDKKRNNLIFKIDI